LGRHFKRVKRLFLGVPRIAHCSAVLSDWDVIFTALPAVRRAPDLLHRWTQHGLVRAVPVELHRERPIASRLPLVRPTR
jgi:hypothetical protein